MMSRMTAPITAVMMEAIKPEPMLRPRAPASQPPIKAPTIPTTMSPKRWLGKLEQGAKWTFCLTTAQDAEIRREHEQTITTEP
jgi:hypothetical protein